MTRDRPSKLFKGCLAAGAVAVVCAALSACATGPPGTARVAGEPRERLPVGDAERAIPRRPDAVVIEPPAAMPDPAERARAQGVVALRPPLGVDAVRDVVLAVVDAWLTESADRLAALLTDDAGPIEARSRGRAVLIDSWRQRMHAHEYHRLAGVELVRPDRIERSFWDDLSAADAPARPSDMRKDELYVRVPFEVTRFAGEQLFGDRMLLLLRREDGKYKIAAYGESEGL